MSEFDQFLKSGSIISLDSKNVIIGFGKRFWHSEPPLGNKPSFFFPDFFFKTATPWFQHQFEKRLSIEDVLKRIPSFERANTHNWSVLGEKNFSEQFDGLMKAFESGSLKKAVPYLFYFSDSPISQANSLKHLLTQTLNQQTFVYGFWDETQGMLGGTPEQLFSLDSNGFMHSEAIAGTVPSHEANTLFEDKKLKQEHDLVIQGIKDALQPFGTVSIGETQVLSLAYLSHLCTPITAQMSETVPIESLIKALHPTPALGAYPKNSGFQWLRNFEQRLPRGRYGAPVGVKEGDFFTSYVAIRNVQWDRKGSKIGVGCGVVNTSSFKKERDELSLKFQAICHLLNLL